MSKVIVTHFNLDLDALFSALSFVEPRDTPEFHFISAAAKELPPEVEGRNPIVVDHPLGIKGKGSAFKEIAGDDFPRDLISDIEEQDSSGTITEPRISIADLFSWSKYFLLEEVEAGRLERKDIDRVLMELWYPVVQGAKIALRRQREAEDLYNRLKGSYITFRGKKFVVVGEGVTLTMEAGKLLNEAGFAGQVYLDGHNMGIVRFPGRNKPDISTLREHLSDEWYVDHRGFMAAYGSRKAPKDRPPEKDPKTFDAFLDLLASL